MHNEFEVSDFDCGRKDEVKKNIYVADSEKSSPAGCAFLTVPQDKIKGRDVKAIRYRVEYPKEATGP